MAVQSEVELTFREFEKALRNKKQRSALEEDCITYSMLRNLTTEDKYRLLHVFSDVWRSGELPLTD